MEEDEDDLTLTRSRWASIRRKLCRLVVILDAGMVMLLDKDRTWPMGCVTDDGEVLQS